MYQFGAAPNGTYHRPQSSVPAPYAHGGVANVQQTQPHQLTPHPPMPQQPYQQPQLTPQPLMQQHQGFPPVYQHQAPSFDQYSGNQQHAPAYHRSSIGGTPFTSQQPGIYGSSPGVVTSQHPGPFGLPSPAANVPFSTAPAWQATQTEAKETTANTGEACYNCGAPDHWAQDCPEPRRAVPAGQANRPAKRQKTHGGNMNANIQTFQQHPPNHQRGWTDPGGARQPPFITPRNFQTPQPGPSDVQRPWVQPQFQRPQMSLTSSTSPAPNTWAHAPHQSPLTPTPASSSHPNPWNHQHNNQFRSQSDVGTSLHHQPGQLVNHSYLSGSPTTIANSPASEYQQHHSNQATLPGASLDKQSMTMSHQAHGTPLPVSQPAHWSHQNLPTPAPSSLDSQIPSPATSNVNSVEHYAHQTPHGTESPANRHDSTSSLHKKNLDPRTQQAEMVASLFSAPDLTPASHTNSPENFVVADASAEQAEDELDELWGCDFPDITFGRDFTVSNPAVLVTKPLSYSINSEHKDEPGAPEASSAVFPKSKYLQDMAEDELLKNVQENPEWDVLKSDPVFAKIKANTATVTFSELVERQSQLLRTVEETEEDDQQEFETAEERLSREQEERLAALGVTGIAKPVKALPTGVSFAEVSSPTETPATRRVSGDPGWKRYENGRPAGHHSTPREKRSPARKNTKSVWNGHQSPSSSSTPGTNENRSPSTSEAEYAPQRKRTYSDSSQEIESRSTRAVVERKPPKLRYKQPKVAAAYARRW